MKASITYWFTFLLLMALIVAPFGCGKRPVATQTEKIVIKDSIVYREKETTERSLAVVDSLNIVIGQIRSARPECDSICQAEIDRILRSINTVKKSGNNGYGITYDERKQLLTLYVDLAESYKKDHEKVKYLQSREKVVQRAEIPVPFVPWYWKYSAYFGWLCAVIIILWLIKKIWLPALK